MTNTIKLTVVDCLATKNASDNKVATKATATQLNTHIVLGKLIGIAMLMILASVIFLSNTAHAAVDVYEFDSPSQEAQYKALIEEFRCPKCQNQNLAGSDSQIAQDLKRKTYDMVMAGQSDQQIRDYMYERYGDFISYKPPVRPSTWVLWFFPPLFLLCLLAWWLWRNARLNKQRIGSSTGVATGLDANTDIVNTDTHLSKHDISSKSGLSSDEKKQLDTLLAKHDSGSDSNRSIKSSHDDDHNKHD